MAGMSDNTRGALLMTGSMASFTFNDAFMKSLGEQLPLFQAIFLRGIGTTLFLIALTVWRVPPWAVVAACALTGWLLR